MNISSCPPISIKINGLTTANFESINGNVYLQYMVEKFDLKLYHIGVWYLLYP